MTLYRPHYQTRIAFAPCAPKRGGVNVVNVYFLGTEGG